MLKKFSSVGWSLKIAPPNFDTFFLQFLSRVQQAELVFFFGLHPGKLITLTRVCDTYLYEYLNHQLYHNQ